MGFIKKIIPITSFALLVVTLILVGCNAWINTYRTSCYSSLDELPEVKTALVLGTAKYVTKGQHNLYFKHRIEAAVELYNSGKISHIIVSGDNATLSYNEPIAMKKDLVSMGIPEDKIHMDYAGFRTLDSVERSKEIFGQDTIIIVSQQFHNQRAIAIAQAKGIKAYGYNAKAVEGANAVKTNFRELFARVKTVLDLTLLQTKSKFYGEKIVIE